MNAQPTKEQILSVACPQCSARSGDACKVRNEEVGAFHAARIGTARRSVAERRETQIRVAAQLLRP
jgi:hypothetical protein